jgi:hypothetical protein
MGYTHYWRRNRVLPVEKWNPFAADCKKIIDAAPDYGIELAGGMGEGRPKANGTRIWFNGVYDCGHPEDNSFDIAWPSKDAGGVLNDNSDPVTGEWFAGAELRTRACGGCCSHETFYIPRIIKKDKYLSEPDEMGRHFECCKTAFKPYDVIVTACLIAFAKHFPECLVSSDGETVHWFDGAMLCDKILGYGINVEITEEEGELIFRSV